MRKVLFTEAQLKHILGEDYPLSTKSGEIPGIAYGTEVSTNTNNFDKDGVKSTTTTDKIAKDMVPQNRWNSRRRYGGSTAIVEEDFDDEKSTGYGKNTDKKIVSLAQNGGGKMIKNIAKDKTHTLNKDYVQRNRMKNYQQTNPELFQKNGGKQMLNTLNKEIRKKQGKGQAERNATKSLNNAGETNLAKSNKPTSAVGKNHHTNDGNSTGNIYYY